VRELNAPRGIADYCERYVPWFRRYVADAAPAQTRPAAAGALSAG